MASVHNVMRSAIEADPGPREKCQHTGINKDQLF
jgi:hypothetical protein